MYVASNKLIIESTPPPYPTHFLMICLGLRQPVVFREQTVILHVHFKECWLPESPTVTQKLEFFESKEKKKRKKKTKHVLLHICKLIFYSPWPGCSPFCWAGERMSPRKDIFRNSILKSWGVLQQECITRTLGRWLTAWVLLPVLEREGRNSTPHRAPAAQG